MCFIWLPPEPPKNSAIPFFSFFLFVVAQGNTTTQYHLFEWMLKHDSGHCNPKKLGAVLGLLLHLLAGMSLSNHRMLATPFSLGSCKYNFIATIDQYDILWHSDMVKVPLHHRNKRDVDIALRQDSQGLLLSLSFKCTCFCLSLLIRKEVGVAAGHISRSIPMYHTKSIFLPMKIPQLEQQQLPHLHPTPD